MARLLVVDCIPQDFGKEAHMELTVHRRIIMGMLGKLAKILHKQEPGGAWEDCATPVGVSQ
jgi:hypothetical protein